jgi:preprotein translocase SecE subunit
MQENSIAHRYALAFYVVFAAYVWYVFRGLGLFVATHYVPQSTSGFSVLNPNFTTWNNGIATALALVVVVGLLAWQKLKDYVVDSGGELTRVSWAELKETQRATIIVCILVIVASIFLFCADFVFLKLVNLVLNTAA